MPHRACSCGMTDGLSHTPCGTRGDQYELRITRWSVQLWTLSPGSGTIHSVISHMHLSANKLLVRSSCTLESDDTVIVVLSLKQEWNVGYFDTFAAKTADFFISTLNFLGWDVFDFSTFWKIIDISNCWCHDCESRNFLTIFNALPIALLWPRDKS